MENISPMPASTLARILQPIFEELVSTGEISVEGKTDEELHQEFTLWAKSNAQRAKTFLFKTDHRPKLLSLARQAKGAEDFDLACFYYATFVEHTLNGIVDACSARKGLSHSSVFSIIREVPLRGKITWLFELLEIRPIPEVHRNRIQQLSEFRNCFVHYKWKGIDIDEAGKPNPQQRKLVEHIEKTISYLRRYETDVAYRSSKKKISRVLVRGCRLTTRRPMNLVSENMAPNPSLQRTRPAAARFGHAPVPLGGPVR